jgi:tRNA-2-methylthio-N6-dimethylallyladenosine synthase
LKEANPDLVINLMGCLVGVKDNHHLAERFPYVDVFSPPSDPGPLMQHLLRVSGRYLELDETRFRNALLDEDLLLPLEQRGEQVAAYVPVVYGCSHACSFCIIPFRRGAERSRPVGEIAHEVRQLTDQGVREVTLLGQIVDRYGMDIEDGPDLPRLLRVVHEIEGIERIRFLTSHPNWMTPRLLQAVAELPKVCEHIEVPAQAGDDVVLERMKRGYTSGDYRRLIETIRSTVPDASIGTDIIVGFPSETEAQFQRTFELLEDLRLDVAHLARYSPRPHTLAMRRMPDNLPEKVKMDRFRALEDLQAEISLEINKGYVGRTEEILVEELHQGRWKGRTRTNKLVFFEAEGDHRGHVVPVHILQAGAWSMTGVPDSQPRERRSDLASAA